MMIRHQNRRKMVEEKEEDDDVNTHSMEKEAKMEVVGYQGCRDSLLVIAYTAVAGDAAVVLPLMCKFPSSSYKNIREKERQEERRKNNSRSIISSSRYTNLH